MPVLAMVVKAQSGHFLALMAFDTGSDLSGSFFLSPSLNSGSSGLSEWRVAIQ